MLSLLSTNTIDLPVFVALVNGVAAAPFMIITMPISSDRTLMGEHRNGHLASWLGWTTVAVMSAAGAVGLWQTLTGS